MVKELQTRRVNHYPVMLPIEVKINSRSCPLTQNISSLTQAKHYIILSINRMDMTGSISYLMTGSISYLIVQISPNARFLPLSWAMKMAATASYNAVPSMFTVAPTGSTNLVTLLSMLLFSSKHLNVTGRVAELEENTHTHIVYKTNMVSWRITSCVYKEKVKL